MWNTRLYDKDKCKLELPEDGIDDVNLEWSLFRQWVSVEFDGDQIVTVVYDRYNIGLIQQL